MDEEVQKFPVWKFLFILLNLLVSILISITGYVTWKVFDVSDRVIGIEHSRCTRDMCSSFNNFAIDAKRTLEWYSARITANETDISNNNARLSILERQTHVGVK